MKKTLSLLLFLLPLMAQAYNAYIDGIYYNFSGTEATVTYKSYKVINNKDYVGEIIIPASVSYKGNTYSVTSIDDSAFWDCDNLTSVTIPNSVTSIGGDAFSECM